MLDSQQIIISIDRRLADARKEIASLEAALTAMSKPSKAARASSTRVARANGAAPAKQTTPTKRAKQAKQATPTTQAAATKQPAPAKEATQTRPAVNGAAPKQTASANGRSRRTRRAPAKRRAEVVPAGKLVTLLGTGGGISTAELVKQTGGDRQQLLTLLRELEAAGTVRRSGERRNTLWHVITDEDRIAERVAQLERQSSRNRQAG